MTNPTFDPNTGTLTLNAEQVIGLANLSMLGFMVADATAPPEKVAQVAATISDSRALYQGLLQELMPSMDAAFTYMTGRDPLEDKKLDN